MKKRPVCSYSNHLILPLKNSNSNKRSEVAGENQVAELQKLSSKIVCSANITRQNLNHKVSDQAMSDDEDEFFQKLQSRVHTDLQSCSKEKRKLYDCHGTTSLSRKKRPIIDNDSLNIMKRFKMDITKQTFVELLDNTNTPQPTCIASNASKEISNKSMFKVSKNVLEQENLFTYNSINMNFRRSSKKYVFQMSTTLQKNNALPSYTNKTNFIQTEYEEHLFPFTPPDSNSIDIEYS